MPTPAILTDQITLVRGDDYYAEDGRALIFSVPFGAGVPNLALSDNIQCSFYAQTGVVPTLVVTGTAQNAGSNAQQVKVELSASQTTSLTATSYLVALTVTLGEVGTSGTHTVTLMRIACTVGNPPG